MLRTVVEYHVGAFKHQFGLDASLFVLRLLCLSQLTDHSAAQVLDSSWHVIVMTV